MSRIIKLCLLLCLIGSGMCRDEEEDEVEKNYDAAEWAQIQSLNEKKIPEMLNEILEIVGQTLNVTLNTTILEFRENNETHEVPDKKLKGVTPTIGKQMPVDEFEKKLKSLYSGFRYFDKSLQNITSKIKEEKNLWSQPYTISMKKDAPYFNPVGNIEEIATKFRVVKDSFQQYQEINVRHRLREEIKFYDYETCRKYSGNLMEALEKIYRQVASDGLTNSASQATELLPKLLQFMKKNNTNNNCNALLYGNPLQFLRQLLPFLINNEIKGLQLLITDIMWYIEDEYTAAKKEKFIKNALKNVISPVLQSIKQLNYRVLNYTKQFEETMDAIPAQFDTCDVVNGTEEYSGKISKIMYSENLSDMSKNRVIVGVRLRVANETLSMQIKERKILSDFRIENSEENEWKNASEDQHRITGDSEKPIIDTPGEFSVMTGIGFAKIKHNDSEVGLQITIQRSIYNPATGKLGKRLPWNSQNITYIHNKEDPTKVNQRDLETIPLDVLDRVELVQKKNGSFVGYALKGYSQKFSTRRTAPTEFIPTKEQTPTPQPTTTTQSTSTTKVTSTPKLTSTPQRTTTPQATNGANMYKHSCYILYSIFALKFFFSRYFL